MQTVENLERGKYSVAGGHFYTWLVFSLGLTNLLHNSEHKIDQDMKF